MRGPVKRAGIKPRVVVSWDGPGEPIVLALYGPAGEVTVPLLPKRALTLAQELLTQGVQAIKAEPGAPWAPEDALGAVAGSDGPGVPQEARSRCVES